MEKAAISLTGRLVISQTGDEPWGLLEVPQSLLDGVFKSLNIIGIEKPEDTAHISVFTSDEIKKIGGPDKIGERGRDFHYTLRALRKVEPEGWDEMQYVYFITCSSPELSKLRESYGLSPLVHGSHPFHITVAVRPKAEEKKSAVDDEEAKKRSERRRRIRNTVLALAGTAAGAYAISKAMKHYGRVKDVAGNTAIDTTSPDAKHVQPTAAPPQTTAAIFDRFKDRLPNDTHGLIDDMHEGYTHGVGTDAMGSVSKALRTMPDSTTKQQLMGIYTEVQNSIQHPTNHESVSRYFENKGIHAFDLSEGSRPARKLMRDIVNSSFTNQRLDDEYLGGLMNAMPAAERESAQASIDTLKNVTDSFMGRLATRRRAPTTVLGNMIPRSPADAADSAAMLAFPAAQFGYGYSTLLPKSMARGAKALAAYPTAIGADAMLSPVIKPVSAAISTSLQNKGVSAPSADVIGGATPWLTLPTVESLMKHVLPREVAFKTPLRSSVRTMRNAYKLMRAGGLSAAPKALRALGRTALPVYLTGQAADLAGTAGSLYGSMAGGDGGDAFFDRQADKLNYDASKNLANRFGQVIFHPADTAATFITAAPTTEKFKANATQGAVDATNSYIDRNAAQARDLLLRGKVDVPEFMRSIQQQADTRFAPQGTTGGSTGLIWNRAGKPVDEAAKAVWIRDRIKGLRGRRS